MAKQQRVAKIDGRELAFSNLDKVYYPESRFTKGEVIAFYDDIADTILPHLRDRPLTMKRYPEGVAGEHFYEKNAPKHTPSWIKTFPIPREEGGSDINYILCNDRATLLWAANLADIEKHVLLARVPEVNHPTSIVFDLDPGEPAGILDCAEIALHLKKLFAAWGLQVFVKVSGSKGLHLSVPLNGDAPYEVTQPFAKTVAELVAHELPKRVVSGMAKSIRAGKVFIDWSQNSDFKTTVCVYSMRAKGAEPLISMPVTWDELARAIKRKDAKHLSFTPAAAIKRIEKVGDLFAPVLKLKQRVPAAFTKALASGPTPKLSRWPRNIKTNERDKSLREYRAKRDLTRTPEPAAPVLPNESKRKGPHRFVIQKHAASHLHYDWRLEMQGVLRSWAVPKGPPTQLKDARLAMHVEDHPLDYEKFEGTIPPGNYGAGTVMVWDYGVYQDITGNDAAAFHSGKMHIVMSGQKLKGEWILVKDKREPESNRWLLIKAGESMKPLSAKLDDMSAISRRSMTAIAKDNDAQWQSNRPAAMARRKMRLTSRQTTQPKFVEPMKCKPVARLPNESNWTFEIKFDGYRCLALKNDDEVKLVSRNEKLLNARFPNVVRALAEVPGDFAIDGEIVALDEEGRPSFQILQNNVSKAYDAYFYAFDLLNRNGEKLLCLPIEERRAFLDELLPEPNDPLRRSPLLDAPSGQVLEAVRKLGLEGVVGKRNGSLYEPGERSGAWIKQRTSAEQEFVIGGYKPGTRGFDSLLVGVYENKHLMFVAQVKDGFVPRLRDEIFAQFKKLRTGVCPFVNLPEKKGARRGDALTAEKMKECRWLKPKLVCQVAFVEWTDAGNLRHAKFIAMRDDKKASEVVRES
ncbi:MAG: non-homologous end-joining DNA ligase [Chthoniobacterales bacterium]